MTENAQYQIREPFWLWVPAGLLGAAAAGLFAETLLLMAWPAPESGALAEGAPFTSWLVILLMAGSMMLVLVIVVFLFFLRMQRGRRLERSFAFGLTASLTFLCLIAAPLISVVVLSASGLIGAVCPPRELWYGALCDNVLGTILMSLLLHAAAIGLPELYLRVAGVPAVIFTVLVPFLVLRRAGHADAAAADIELKASP